nr:arginine deiminase family protein [Afifella pfennigii]
MSDPAAAYRFTRAILREPAPSVVSGLRAEDRGDPSFDSFLSEHLAYRAALEAAGLSVHVEPALPELPDSVFVEDPAFVLPEGGVLLRMSAPSREEETDEIADALAAFVELTELQQGYVDGGDLLFTGREVIAGLSRRTDEEGLQALSRILADWGYPLRPVAMPEGLLHLKTGCALLDEETVLAVPLLARSGVFSGYRVVETPEGEEAAANALRLNAVMLIASGYRETAEMLSVMGYEVLTTPVTQAELLDGGLSCMSIRF